MGGGSLFLHRPAPPLTKPPPPPQQLNPPLKFTSATLPPLPPPPSSSPSSLHFESLQRLSSPTRPPQPAAAYSLFLHVSSEKEQQRVHRARRSRPTWVVPALESDTEREEGMPNEGSLDLLSGNGKQLLNSIIERPPQSLNAFFDSCKKELLRVGLIGLLRALDRSGNWEKALLLFEWIVSNSELDNGIIAVMVRILGRQSQYSVLSSLFEKIDLDDYKLDVRAYNTILDAHSREGKYEKAVALLERMNADPQLGNFPTGPYYGNFETSTYSNYDTDYTESYGHHSYFRCDSCFRYMQMHRLCELNDGRDLCQDCLSMAVLDENKFQRIITEVKDFFRSHDLDVDEDFPILLVDSYDMRELTSSSPYWWTVGGLHTEMSPDVRTIERCEIREGMVVPIKSDEEHTPTLGIAMQYGMATALTTRTLAHEMMHMWMTLQGYDYTESNLKVYEGIAEVIANMWVEECALSEIDAFEWQVLVESVASLGHHYHIGCIEARRAVDEHGLKKVLNEILENGSLP